MPYQVFIPRFTSEVALSPSFLQPQSVGSISSQLAWYEAPGIMLRACRIIAVWAALRASQQRIQRTDSVASKLALRPSLIRGSLASQEENP